MLSRPHASRQAGKYPEGLSGKELALRIASETMVIAELSVCAGSVQDPAQADKLTKIQRDLDETKVILHKTIESMLERGEKLDSLVDKSSDLSMASQMFYKQARKTNSCCKMM